MRTLAALALILAGCTATVEPTGAGYTEGSAVTSDGTELPLAVWYPADVREADVNATYTFGVSGDAYVDAPPATGPFPIVVVSHGNGGSRHAGAAIHERWAEAGYVVVAMDHVGNTFEDRITQASFIEVFVRRPADVAASYAEVAGWSQDADHLLAGAIDPTRLAVAGHSTGGSTALLVSGGGMDKATLLLACGAGQLEGDVCDLVAAADGDTVTLVPDGIPAPAASLLFAPLNGGLFADDLDVTGATFVAVGSRDTVTPLARDSQPIYDAVPDPRALAVIEGANHYNFATICSVPDLVEFNAEVAADCEDPDLLSEAEFVDLTAAMSLGWLDAYLKADATGTARAEAAADRGPVEWAASL